MRVRTVSAREAEGRAISGRLLTVMTILTVLGAAACGQETPPPQSGGTPPATIRVSGSGGGIALLKKLGQEFERSQSAVRLQFLPETHSRGAIAGVASANLDVGVVSRELLEDERGAGLQYFHLAQGPIVLVVHKEVRVEALTRRQVRAVFSGEVTDWLALGGSPGRIQVVDRPEHESAKIYLRRLLLGRETRVTPQAMVIENEPDVPEVIERVPGAIGYISLSALSERQPGLRAVTLDGVGPTLRSAAEGKYRLARPLGLVVPAQPKREVMPLLDFIFGEVGRQVVEGAGYVPVVTNLVVGVVPEQDILSQSVRYAPLARYLSERLGVQTRVEIRLFPSYGQVLQSLKEGQINAAFLGSLGFVEARQRMAVEAVARPVMGGVAEYRGILLVRRDSGLSAESTFKGLRLSLVDRHTTAGYLFPVLFFRQRGVSRLEGHFSSVRYVGSHDATILQLLRGEVDVAATKDTVFRRLAAQEPRIERELEVIARSEAVPENALVLGNRADVACFSCHERRQAGPMGAVSLGDRLRRILLHIHEDEAGRAALGSLGAERFIPTSDAEYEPVRRMWQEVRGDRHALAENP